MLVNLGINTTVTTTGAAAVEIRTDANTRLYVLEIDVSIGVATASVYGIGLPAAIGITPTTPINFLPCDPADVMASGRVQSAVAWGTGPTVPAQFARRFNIPATIGAGIVLPFLRGGYVVAPSSSLVLWNLGTNAANCNFTLVGEI